VILVVAISYFECACIQHVLVIPLECGEISPLWGARSAGGGDLAIALVVSERLIARAPLSWKRWVRFARHRTPKGRACGVAAVFVLCM